VARALLGHGGVRALQRDRVEGGSGERQEQVREVWRSLASTLARGRGRARGQEVGALGSHGCHALGACHTLGHSTEQLAGARLASWNVFLGWL
jgi:hypothetical protein